MGFLTKTIAKTGEINYNSVIAAAFPAYTNGRGIPPLIPDPTERRLPMKKILYPVLSGLALLIMLAGETYVSYQLVQLGMVPNKYLALFFGVFLLITALLAFLAFPRRTDVEKVSHLIRRIIAWILALLIGAGCFMGGDAIAKIRRTMEAVTNVPEISDIIGIYVRADDPADTLSDIQAYPLGITEAYDWENTQALLTEHAGELAQTALYANVFEMVDALYAGEVDAIILNTAYLSLMEEVEPYMDIYEKTKLVYEYIIHEPPTESAPTEPSQTETSQPTEPTDTQPEEKGMPSFILYLAGSDSRAATLQSKGRNDVNILAVVNPNTKQILLINTPRDYYVANPAGNGGLDKLTHCGNKGMSNSMTALEDLYGIEITYYARINFVGFETLVDAVGGVTIYSELAFTTTHGKYAVQKGENTFNGKQALCYARERYSLPNGDKDRGKNQMKLIKAILEKMTAGTLLTRYSQILDSMKSTFTTSIPPETITEFVKMQMENMASWNIQSYAVTGTGATRETWSMPGWKLSVCIPDLDSVEKANDLITRVMAGEILTEEDMK